MKNLNKDILRNIYEYIFYSKEDIVKFKKEWSRKMLGINLFFYNVNRNIKIFPDASLLGSKYMSHEYIREKPCIYCNSKQHTILICKNYYIELVRHNKKLQVISAKNVLLNSHLVGKLDIVNEYEINYLI